MNPVIIVVPCYNEEARLNLTQFVAAADAWPDLGFVFVDDGSLDGTQAELRSLCQRLGEARSSLLCLDENRGKAEAVRLGVLAAMQQRPFATGYWDADLSTPLSEVRLFTRLLEASPEAVAVFGARVRLLGRRIERNAVRHYSGRVFATLAAFALGFPVYDTQCGAKLFRVTPEVRAVFGERFMTHWAFDVEILARLAGQLGPDLDQSGRVIEQPLSSWTDVTGSKLRLRHLPGMVLDLAKVYRRYR